MTRRCLSPAQPRQPVLGRVGGPDRSARPSRSARLPLAVALLALVALPAAAHKPHEHGKARLEVLVEPAALVLRLDGALDGFVGFERAPRNDAERQRVEQARQRLQDAATLFTIDPAAGCRLQQVTLDAAVLGWAGAGGTAGAANPASPATPATAPAKASEHADLAAEFRFACTDATRAGFLEVGLFQAFSRMRRVEVEAVTPQAQLRQELRRPATRVALRR
jgi:hypothetical protein